MYLLLISLVTISTALFAERCCDDSCFEFKKAKNYCGLITNDLQVLQSGVIENATFRSKYIIDSEIIDGDVIVHNGAEFNNGLTVNGELIINGDPFVPGNTNFATFVSNDTVLIANDAIVPFDTVGESSAGIILNADGSFTLVNPGIYVINFYLLLAENESGFAISTIPAGPATKLPFTTFGRGGINMPLNGFTIIQTTLPNTTLGIQNVSNADQTLNNILAPLTNVTASVQIIRIG